MKATLLTPQDLATRWFVTLSTLGQWRWNGRGPQFLKTELPYKATKSKPLDKEEKACNKALSRIRVKVENILGDIKTFRILSERYRNKRKRYNIKFKIVAAIVNLKNGFSSA